MVCVCGGVCGRVCVGGDRWVGVIIIKELTTTTAEAIKDDYISKPSIRFNDNDSAISIDRKEEIINAVHVDHN